MTHSFNSPKTTVLVLLLVLWKNYDQSNLDEGRVYWVHASRPQVISEEVGAGTQVGTEADTVEDRS